MYVCKLRYKNAINGPTKTQGLVMKKGKRLFLKKETEGQYTFIVMDLTNLSDNPYEMSLCTVGIMGTRYVRDGPENLEITIVRGDQGQIEIQRVYSEMEIATDLNINLRLKN